MAKKVPPKGCMAIRVGNKEEEQQSFVVPVKYLNHPLFASLLKEAEEEYGFRQKGAFSIPCHVDDFRNIRRLIDHENSAAAHHHHNHHHHHHNHHHHHLPLITGSCFRA